MKVLKFKPANQSTAPDVYIRPVTTTKHFLMCGIKDAVLDKLSEHGQKLCGVGVSPNDVLKESARATGIVFLSILSEMPAVEREKVLQEFDTLTLQHINI
jgi:hypothetical protein